MNDGRDIIDVGPRIRDKVQSSGMPGMGTMFIAVVCLCLGYVILSAILALLWALIKVVVPLAAIALIIWFVMKKKR